MLWNPSKYNRKYITYTKKNNIYIFSKKEEIFSKWFIALMLNILYFLYSHASNINFNWIYSKSMTEYVYRNSSEYLLIVGINKFAVFKAWNGTVFLKHYSNPFVQQCCLKQLRAHREPKFRQFSWNMFWGNRGFSYWNNSIMARQLVQCHPLLRAIGGAPIRVP